MADVHIKLLALYGDEMGLRVSRPRVSVRYNGLCGNAVVSERARVSVTVYLYLFAFVLSLDAAICAVC